MRHHSEANARTEPPYGSHTPPRLAGRQPFSILHSSFFIPSSAWGALAGLAASLCCIGPSAAVLLGLGASSALFGLQVARPLALAAGAALLLAGLIFALRRARACAARGAARWRQPALMLAAFALAYGLLGLLAPWAAARQEDVAVASVALPAAPAATLRRATLTIDQMDCPPCAAHARSLLRRQPFVQGFFAESGIDQVTIDYDSRQIDAQGVVELFPPYYGVALIGDSALP